MQSMMQALRDTWAEGQTWRSKCGGFGAFFISNPLPTRLEHDRFARQFRDWLLGEASEATGHPGLLRVPPHADLLQRIQPPPCNSQPPRRDGSQRRGW